MVGGDGAAQIGIKPDTGAGTEPLAPPPPPPAPAARAIRCSNFAVPRRRPTTHRHAIGAVSLVHVIVLVIIEHLFFVIGAVDESMHGLATSHVVVVTDRQPRAVVVAGAVLCDSFVQY